MTILRHLLTASLLLLSASPALAQVRIDDSNVFSGASLNGIQYSKGQWNDKNSWYAAQRYNGTYHSAVQPGSHFAFFFRGSSIKYYADRDPKGGPIIISLDGGSTVNIDGKPPTTAFQFQQELWSAAALDSGDHYLVVTSVSGTIGVDWLEVVPVDGTTDTRPAQLGPGAFEIPPNAAIVDDSVVSIEWSGSGWQNAGDTGSAAYYQNSMHKTTNPGDSATFRFNGTAVWYFTDMINGNAPVLISIDGGQGEMVQTAPSGGAGGRTQKLAWSKTGLSDSQHTINIRHAGSAGNPAGVDFLMYMPGSGGGSNSGSPGSSGSNSGSNNTTTKSTPIGPIVGGVVGGVVLLALLTIFLVIRARDKREKREHGRQMEQAVTRPVRPAAESYTKEGWSSPPPPSALSYGSPSSGNSYGQPTSVMGGGSSGHTNFSARGYVGYPEVQQR